ncbi:hypothetical protein SAMN05216246_11221 [Actinomyces denticolens]|uniref:Uncharacterized protein n=1 Tax=Actinomyces denticolens TaxID=52767 RepID=A0ABY1IGA9_9ACTO|nr:hypothetical protein [Actinomyces denticolens]SHJ13290.1 hypothetical protein SAMN05216246_11221 [Actinomyces denticolens]
MSELRVGFEIVTITAGRAFVRDASTREPIVDLERADWEIGPGQWMALPGHVSGYANAGDRAARAVAWGRTRVEAANAALEALGAQAPRVHTTREDAVQREVIEVLAGVPGRYDTDAIADEVLTTTGSGTRYRWVLDETVDYWGAVARHALDDEAQD